MAVDRPAATVAGYLGSKRRQTARGSLVFDAGQAIALVAEERRPGSAQEPVAASENACSGVLEPCALEIRSVDQEVSGCGRRAEV